MFDFLPRLAVVRPVLTTMLIVVFVVMGAFSYLSLRTDLFPDIDFPVVVIITAYPGAGPEEIETQVTEPIEDAVASLALIDDLSSSSREGLSTVVIFFDFEADPDQSVQEVRDQLEQVRATLPAEAEPPTVWRMDLDAMPIMNLALSGPQGVDALFELADEDLRYRLARVDGVANVNVVGGRPREVQVLVHPERLDAYGLALGDIVELIRAENVAIPAGRVEEPAAAIPVRVVGQYRSLDELRDLRLLRQQGEVVRLGDVATVVAGYGDLEQVARLNGEPAVSIAIQRRSGSNVVHTAEGVRDAVESIRADLPPGVTIEVVRDESEFISDSVNDVLMNLLIGILLTSLVLFFFLHSWRGTIIAAAAMPATVISAFLLMNLAGFSLNIITLGALGITVGILVTNTIVVLESIYRQLDAGASPGDAAQEGTKRVGIAVAASTLTNLVVFTPIAFMEGIVGQFFYALGLTVVFATLFSILISFTLAPLLAARLLRMHESQVQEEGAWLAPLWRRWDRGYENMEDGYRGILTWALGSPWRGWVVLVGIVAVAVTLAGVSARFVPMDFLPTADERAVQVELELPPGTPIQRTSVVSARAEEALKDVPEIASMLTTISGEGAMFGMGGAANAADIMITLHQEGRSTPEIIREMRSLLADLPDADLTVFAADPAAFGPAGAHAFRLQVAGPDYEELERITGGLAERLETLPEFSDVTSSVEAARVEAVFRPDRASLADYGLTVGQIGGLLRTSLAGTIAGTYRGEAGRESEIRVRLAEDARSQVDRLALLRVRTPLGLIPLDALGAFEESDAAAVIQRVDRQRATRIDAVLNPGVAVDEAAGAAQQMLAESPLPPGYDWSIGGTYEMMQEAMGTVLVALLLAIVLTYIVLAMILESFIHPITIMLTLPLGLVGAFLGLFFFGATMNIIAMMAVIMLVGIVVNNAILILDYTRQLREEGSSVVEALVEAAPVRLRPIIMSNIAIAVALVPQLVGTGAAAVFRVPLAAVTIGGVLVSAIFTLFLIPVIYLKMESVVSALRSLLPVRDSSGNPAPASARIAGD